MGRGDGRIRESDCEVAEDLGMQLLIEVTHRRMTGAGKTHQLL